MWPTLAQCDDPIIIEWFIYSVREMDSDNMKKDIEIITQNGSITQKDILEREEKQDFQQS